MPEQDTPSTPDGASLPAEIPAPAVSKLSVYHRDVAVQHFSAKLGASYQTMLLLAFIWTCVNDPWELEPTVYLAASRLEWIIAGRTNRSAAMSKLVKLGAIKKGRATRSGCKYTLLRPPINKLSTKLQDELANMSAHDYRYKEGAAPLVGLSAPKRAKSVRLKGLPRVSREKLDVNNKRLGITWPKLARCLETIARLGKGSLRYGADAGDVTAFAVWLRKHKIKREEFGTLCKLVKYSERPDELALRYVFEVDTLQKRAYLDGVLSKLRPESGS